MCSGSEASSYSRLIDFVSYSTLGLRVTKKMMIKCFQSLDVGKHLVSGQGCESHESTLSLAWPFPITNGALGSATAQHKVGRVCHFTGASSSHTKCF